jgi:hypothetical protein
MGQFSVTIYGATGSALSDIQQWLMPGDMVPALVALPSLAIYATNSQPVG